MAPLDALWLEVEQGWLKIDRCSSFGDPIVIKGLFSNCWSNRNATHVYVALSSSTADMLLQLSMVGNQVI